MSFPTLNSGDLIGVQAAASPVAAHQLAAVQALYARWGYAVRLYPS